MGSRSSRSLAAHDAELARELDEERSGFGADEISAFTGRPAWWICSSGHRYRTAVSNRSALGQGCQQCWHLRNGSLEERCPEIAAELEEELSGFCANEIAAQSGFRAWWRCTDCQHLYSTTVAARTRGQGCPCHARHWHLERLRWTINYSLPAYRACATRAQRRRYFEAAGVLASTASARTLAEALIRGTISGGDLDAWLAGREVASVARVLRRHRRRTASGKDYLSPVLRATVYARDGHCCRACSSTDDLSLDHIVPECAGGKSSAENLQTLCRTCNCIKNARQMSLPAIRRRRAELGYAPRAVRGQSDSPTAPALDLDLQMPALAA